MKKFLIWLPLLLIGLLLIVFITANRQEVELVLVPGALPLRPPLFVVFFLGIFTGLAIAAVFELIRRFRAGLKSMRQEREVRALRKKIAGLEAELGEAQGQKATADQPRIGASGDQTKLAKR